MVWEYDPEPVEGKPEITLKTDTMLAFIKAKVPESEVDTADKKIIVNHPRHFGPPDPPALNAILFGENELRKAEAAWMELMKYNGYHALICSDPVVQSVIVSMGGWESFCRYRDGSNTWCHMVFTERYRSMDGIREVEPMLLRGDSDEVFRGGKFVRRVAYVGDEQKCRLIHNDVERRELSDTRRTGLGKIEFKNVIGGQNEERDEESVV
jgi:hypothetical protein